MSLAEKIAQLIPEKKADGQEQNSKESNQLKDLEEVELILKDIGVSLEPRFDVSLGARIGTARSLK